MSDPPAGGAGHTMGVPCSRFAVEARIFCHATATARIPAQRVASALPAG